jgi:hypothetical protein
VAGYKGRRGPWLASAGGTFSTRKGDGRLLKRFLMRLSLNMDKTIFLVKWMFCGSGQNHCDSDSGPSFVLATWKMVTLMGVGHIAVVPEKVAFLSICDHRCLDFVYLSRALTTLDSTCLRVAF